MHLFFMAQSLSLTLEFCLYTISREQSNIKYLLEALMLSGISSLCIPFLSFSHIVMALDYTPPPKLCLWWGILFSRCPSIRDTLVFF